MCYFNRISGMFTEYKKQDADNRKFLNSSLFQNRMTVFCADF